MLQFLLFKKHFHNVNLNFAVLCSFYIPGRATLVGILDPGAGPFAAFDCLQTYFCNIKF